MQEQETWGLEKQLHIFFFSHYMSVSGQLHAIVILPPMKEASSIL
jgi:hypothetical protein